MGFPGGSVVKNLPTNVGDVGSNPGLGRPGGGGNGNPTPVFLSGGPPWTEESGGLQSLWVQKSLTQLGD